MNITINILSHEGEKLRRRWVCKGYTGCIEIRGKIGIYDRVRDFAVQGMSTRNGETWDVSETQLYVVLPL